MQLLSTVADPGLELKGGREVVLFALVTFLPSVIFPFLPKLRGSLCNVQLDYVDIFLRNYC